jgi:membrane fusion protein (multidrug efflux system)
MLRLKNVLVIAMTLMVFQSCFQSKGQEDGSWGENSAWNQTPEYPVMKIVKGNYLGYKTYPTNMKGIRYIEVRSKVSGYIDKIFVDEGQMVEKGQLLFQLETDVLSKDAEAAKSNVKSAEANVKAAELEVQKLTPLVQQKIISEVQLTTAQEKLNVANAQLAQARSNHESIKANIKYTKIVSPVDGIVGQLNFRKGSLVGPSSADALTSIADNQVIQAYFSLTESDLLKLTKNLEGNSLFERLKQLPNMKLVLSDDSIYEEEGTIDASTGTINPETGAIQLRASFMNPKGLIGNGSSGKILFPKEYKNSLAIPALSTFEKQGQRFVYVLEDKNTLQMRRIDVQDKIGKVFLVGNGLKSGDTILAQGVNKVNHGSVIAPKMVSMQSITESFQTVFK